MSDWIDTFQKRIIPKIGELETNLDNLAKRIDKLESRLLLVGEKYEKLINRTSKIEGKYENITDTVYTKVQNKFLESIYFKEVKKIPSPINDD